MRGSSKVGQRTGCALTLGRLHFCFSAGHMVNKPWEGVNGFPAKENDLGHDKSEAGVDKRSSPAWSVQGLLTVSTCPHGADPEAGAKATVLSATWGSWTQTFLPPCGYFLGARQCAKCFFRSEHQPLVQCTDVGEDG